MKFGKQILSQSVPEWMHNYLNYKALKTQIKRVVAAQKIDMLKMYAAKTEHLPQEEYEPPLRSLKDEQDEFRRLVQAQFQPLF